MMSNGKIDIALDLGYASIGWAVAEENGHEPIMRGCGTVVFEPNACLASARRGYRRQRRHIRATRTRILRMKDFLIRQGVLTPAVAGLKHPHPEPWRLSAQALRGERTLTAPELWAVLLWYAHNRGYDGNRLWSHAREDDEDTKKVEAAKDAMQQYGTATVAETVLDIVTDGNPDGPAKMAYKARNLAFDRRQTMREAETILRAHIGRLPGLTEAAVHALMADPVREPDALRAWPSIPKAYLGGLLAGQIKPRFDNRLAPRCPIDGAKTPLKSCDAFLAFRWAELLSHVRVGFMGQALRPLAPEELKALDDGIRKTGRYTAGDFIKAVRSLVACDHDNLDALLSGPDTDKDRLVRYPGLAQLDATFGIENFRQDDETQKALRHLSHRLAKGKEVPRADILPLLAKVKPSKGKKPPAEKLSAPLPAGRAPYSERVMRQAVAEIFAGKDPRAEGGVLYRDATKEDPLPEAGIDRATNNHLVRHRIKILLRLLGDIVHDYAENNPARIGTLFVEVARDIKDFSGKTQTEIKDELSRLRRASLQATAKAAKMLGCPEAAVTAGLTRKMRIAADLNFTCPYTGKTFDAWDIRSKTVDLDHILPRSQRTSDSLDSLILTFRTVNALKGNRTARQFLHDCAGQEVVATDPNGGKRVLQIKDEAFFLNFMEQSIGSKIRWEIGSDGYAHQCGKQKNQKKEAPKDEKEQKTRGRKKTKEEKIAEERVAKCRVLTVDEAEGMTQGMLTQTSAIAKLAHRAILGWFKARGCKPIRPTLIPGRVTKEVRNGYNLLGMLAQFDARLTQSYEENGVQKTKVVPKGDMRALTHMHHAVDAIAILLAGTLITPQNRVWDLMAKRRQTEEERLFLRANGPFAWDSHGHLTLQRLAPAVERPIRVALGELRTVRYASKRLGRTVLKETQWRVVNVKDGRVFLRQGHGNATKRTELALSAVYGLNPPNGDGKLLHNKAVYVGDANYAIALTNPPAVLRERFVWRELQALAAKNGGKAPKLLRKGDLIETKEGGEKHIWMIRSIKDNKGTLLLDLTVPYNAEGAKNGVPYWKINTRLASLLKAGAGFPRYRLTGIPACPITSLKSPASKTRKSTAETDSSTAE